MLAWSDDREELRQIKNDVSSALALMEGGRGGGRRPRRRGSGRSRAVEAVATDPAMVPIKESTQQAQATTANRRSTRGMAQVTAMAQIPLNMTAKDFENEQAVRVDRGGNGPCPSRR